MHTVNCALKITKYTAKSNKQKNTHTCSPMGFPSSTTFFKPLFSMTPAQMVKQATLSMLLLVNINVSSL